MPEQGPFVAVGLPVIHRSVTHQVRVSGTVIKTACGQQLDDYRLAEGRPTCTRCRTTYSSSPTPEAPVGLMIPVLHTSRAPYPCPSGVGIYRSQDAHFLNCRACIGPNPPRPDSRLSTGEPPSEQGGPDA